MAADRPLPIRMLEMSRLSGHARSLLLDASCLLNLYATDRLREIAKALPYQLWVSDYVLEQEALYVRRPGSTGMWEAPESVDLALLVDEGLIQLMRLEHPAEEATFVDLAALVDDGEAITGALALHRGCSVATDDRKARRVLGERTPSVALVSTLELLKLWAEEAVVPRVELRAAMAEMQSGASYIPGARDPLYEWWRSIVSGSGT